MHLVYIFIFLGIYLILLIRVTAYFASHRFHLLNLCVLTGSSTVHLNDLIRRLEKKSQSHQRKPRCFKKFDWHLYIAYHISKLTPETN